MNNRLNIPPELRHLIEKREQADRREPSNDGEPVEDGALDGEAERRKMARRATDDAGRGEQAASGDD